MKQLFIVAALFCFAQLAASQTYAGCKGTPNNLPLVDKKPTLAGVVQNGKKYTVPYDGRDFYILVLNGSAYEMGYAQGVLMSEEINIMIPFIFEWFQNFIETNVSFVAKLPKFIRDWVGSTAIWGAKKVLDLNYWITLPYTNPRWDQEMLGLAQGTNLTVWLYRQLNLLPELLKASCSILGGFGNSTSTKKTIHLRSLDWEEHAPMSRWPQITVYHSSEAGSVPFANIGWPALIGSLTGYSAAKIGVGERLWGSPASDETRFGTPWMYVLRDALQFSKTQPQYIQYLKDAHRTCAIYLGVGGLNEFSILKYNAAYLQVFNYTTWNQDTHHPANMTDILWKAYHDDSDCFRSILADYYGNVTPETIYRLIAPMGQTGDSQVAVMDYLNDVVYMMYPNPNSFNPGYNAPAIKIDLKPFFAQSALD